MFYQFHQIFLKDAVERLQLSLQDLLKLLQVQAFLLETQFIIATALNYISEEQTKTIIEELNILQKRLNALREAILISKY